ncbi:Glyoxalase/Bleomycin resistance protein/Dioxygenase superfamily protein [Oceanobacillus limi]|uniref:Glyoxalase/Bleomycin resistance protein/Dioxygenase superfamily protein n=1 Tax=Oceanobacillus limi TaxID=930131 RepID=A0A1H9Y3X0_9BACI|nr:VOC family protein [Oceanobacillus limi]SES63457.1 Glyoxalase/Bleomycin resistance protein/Dioxygenase superfamily protein [Oceanobacillus limi]
MEFKDFNATQIRIARPTDKFEEVIDFYENGLGLARIGEFKGHRGYEGVIIGLPDVNYHLEFTRHIDGSPCPAPTKDNLLVFYIPDKAEIDIVSQRLSKMGYEEVEPENKYWEEEGITIEDPDGWRIVLMNRVFE